MLPIYFLLVNESEQEMQPKSESTRLEGPNGLVEYQGSGKLKNKKAIITGGEYTFFRRIS